MTTGQEELVRKLASAAIEYVNFGHLSATATRGESASMLTQAADTIASLVRERDTLIAAVADHVTIRGEYFQRLSAAEAERDALQGVVEELRAALKRLVAITDEFAQVDHEIDHPTDAQVQEWHAAVDSARSLSAGVGSQTKPDEVA